MSGLILTNPFLFAIGFEQTSNKNEIEAACLTSRTVSDAKFTPQNVGYHFFSAI